MRRRWRNRARIYPLHRPLLRWKGWCLDTGHRFPEWALYLDLRLCGVGHRRTLATMRASRPA